MVPHFHLNFPLVSIAFGVDFAVQKLEYPVSGTGYPFYGNGCSKLTKATLLHWLRIFLSRIFAILIHRHHIVSTPSNLLLASRVSAMNGSWPRVIAKIKAPKNLLIILSLHHTVRTAAVTPQAFEAHVLYKHVSLGANPESHRIILSSTPLKSLSKISQCLAFTVYTIDR